MENLFSYETLGYDNLIKSAESLIAKSLFLEAIADINEAIAEQPDKSYGYYLRSVIKQSLGDSFGADADSKKYHQLEGTNP